MPAASLPGGDGEQPSASLSAQLASLETLLALWYRLRSFVYKYAGEQEIKERGRRGSPEKVTGGREGGGGGRKDRVAV